VPLVVTPPGFVSAATAEPTAVSKNKWDQNNFSGT
jgi:hypothetical protein